MQSPVPLELTEVALRRFLIVNLKLTLITNNNVIMTILVASCSHLQLP